MWPAATRLRSVKVLAICAALAFSGLVSVSATASEVPHDKVVSQEPSPDTPWINNGRVYDIAVVGDVVIAGGTFTSVSETGGSPTYARTGIVAFDATTGAVLTDFDPQLNGAVNALVPGPVPNSVLVGGSFNTIDGQQARVLALLDATTGDRITSFDPPTLNGAVNDLDVHDDRLYVGGNFRTADGVEHGGVAALDFATGAIDHDFLQLPVSENHNYEGSGAQAAVGVKALSVAPDGTSLAMVGNFRKVDGIDRRQAALIDTSGSTAELADWRTRRFEPRCSWRSFDTYMRDVDFAPDSSYFSIATTGGPNPGSLCDTVSAWDASETGDQLQPTWVDDTGGDTLWSTEATGSAVYAGGHQRWHNNAGGRDFPAAGSVPRPGLVAVDPDGGVPLSWNPGVNPRGAGVFALVQADDGLWMGNDREWLGIYEYRRPRIAFFPLDGGVTPPPGETAGLPGSVYLGGQPADSGLTRRPYDGESETGADESVDAGGVNWTNVRGAVQVDDSLFYGTLSGMFYRRTFDGESFGEEQEIDPYRDEEWCEVSSGSGGHNYCGRLPTFYNELLTVTGMAYRDGRLYYTMAGHSALYWRGFSPESGIVSERFAVSGVSMPQIMGMFVADDHLYYATSVNGSLWRRPIGDDGPTGTATQVSGSGIDGLDWRARGLFTAPGGGPPGHQPPTASFTYDCEGFTCQFDASDSTDPDGEIVSYEWDFGDGSTGDGVEAEHTFSEPGSFDVELTVVDDDDNADSDTETVLIVGDAVIEFNAANSAAQHTTSPSVTIPGDVDEGDALLLFVSVNKDGIDVDTPAGWDLVAEQSAGGAMVTLVYAKNATASDGGSQVATPLSQLSKVDLTVLAYSGADPDAIAQVESDADPPSSDSHTTPALTADVDGGLVVSYWADKSSVVTDWTAPDGEEIRSESIGPGSGRVTSLATDGGEPTAAGADVGGLTATTDEAAPRATMWTIVLRPG